MNLPSSFINVSPESGGVMKLTTSPYYKGGLNCFKLGIGLRSMILPIFMVFLWTNGIDLVKGEERKYADFKNTRHLRGVAAEEWEYLPGFESKKGGFPGAKGGQAEIRTPEYPEPENLKLDLPTEFTELEEKVTFEGLEESESGKQLGVELKNLKDLKEARDFPGTKTMTEKNHRPQKEPCVLILNEVLMTDNSEIEKVECFELSTKYVFDVSGISQDELKAKMRIFEGQALVTLMQNGAYYDDQNATLLLHPDLESIEFGEYKSPQNRRKLATTGTRSIVVLRVNALDANTTSSVDVLERKWFTDSVNMKSQYAACSYGKLEFVNMGVVSVSLGRRIANSSSFSIMNAVIRAAESQYNVDLDNFDHVAICLPPGTVNNGRKDWLAYANLGIFGGWFSVYNDDWCNSVSVQMHEIGHNFNLGHSNENEPGSDETEYKDQSGVMGYSYWEDSTEMCFNGPKSWQLGWYSDRHRIVEMSWSGRLYGISHYRQAGNGDAVILKIPGRSVDWYVSFNRQAGINGGTKEGGDQVLVHKKRKGTIIPWKSYLMAKLSSGDTYDGAPLPIRVTNITSSFSTVEIGTVTPNILTVYPGVWGDWKNWSSPINSERYACGARLRIERWQLLGDDTAANGLELKYCDLSNWWSQEETMVYPGVWGDWGQWKMCPSGKYIGGANVRFETPQGVGDDTALNGLALYCVDRYWRGGETVVVNYGMWGNWKGWEYSMGKFINSARVRFEDPVGGGDDTAWNGLQLSIKE